MSWFDRVFGFQARYPKITAELVKWREAGLIDFRSTSLAEDVLVDVLARIRRFLIEEASVK